jgi:hypothetical protein
MVIYSTELNRHSSTPITLIKDLPFAFDKLYNICIQVCNLVFFISYFKALFFPRQQYKGHCMAYYNVQVRNKCFKLSNDIKMDILQHLRPSNELCNLSSYYDNDLITDNILYMFCPFNVTQLDLSWCKHISLASLQYVTDICGESITSLTLTGIYKGY